MEQNNIPPDLMDKLQKLMNLAEGAKAIGSHAEAENAAAKAQAMLLKYNLSEDDVINHGIKKQVEMGHRRIDIDAWQAKTEAGWVQLLVNGVAHACMCRAVLHGYKRHAYDQGEMTIVGDMVNVGTAYYIIEQMVTKIGMAGSIAWKQYNGPEKRNTFRRGFLIGAVNAIVARLKEEEQKLLGAGSSYTPVEQKQMGLILVNKRELAKQHMYNMFPNLRSVVSRQGNLSGRDGHAKGREAGGNMDINRGTKTKGYLD